MFRKIVLITFFICLSYVKDTNCHEDHLFYPCKSLDNLECIRDYFHSTGQCTRTTHQDGQPMHQDKHICYVPRLNVTIFSHDEVLLFYGSAVKSFYVNKNTNNLVMVVHFDGINLASSRIEYFIDQRGREPLLVKDYCNITYYSELTAVIPSAGKDGISGAKVSAYNPEAMPIFNLGPAISKSSIPAVQKVYQGFLEDVFSSVEEIHLTKAPYFFFSYLQNYICDYGHKFVGKIAK